jgi:hypothetical protein
LEDLTAFSWDIPAYEPLDVVNFFTILEQDHAKYLRIPHQHFPESIFSTEDIGVIDAQVLNTIEVLSLRGYGYAGDAGTIVATGANFANILQLGDALAEQKSPMDIFVLNKLTTPFTQELKNSLHQTKKLIFVIDHLPSPAFQQKIASLIDAS